MNRILKISAPVSVRIQVSSWHGCRICHAAVSREVVSPLSWVWNVDCTELIEHGWLDGGQTFVASGRGDTWPEIGLG